MLEYMFGDTPKVRVIEFMANCNILKNPSKKEIAEGAEISLEELNEIYDDLIDIGFLIKDEDEDKHWMCSHELADGLFFIMQEIRTPYYHKMEKLKKENIKNQAKKHERFLKDNFNFDMNDFYDICEIIVENGKMEKIIYELPEIIAREIPESQIDLNVMHFLTCNNSLKIVVNTKLNGDALIEKENIIKTCLNENYNTSAFNLIVK